MNNEYSQLDLFQSLLKTSPKEVISETKEADHQNKSNQHSTVHRDEKTLVKPVEKKLVFSEPEFLIIPFPLNRRTKKIRYAATTFVARTTDEKKQRFWDQTVNQLAGQMKRYGIGEPEIEKQVSAFRDAVSDEIYLQQQSKENHS